RKDFSRFEPSRSGRTHADVYGGEGAGAADEPIYDFLGGPPAKYECRACRLVPAVLPPDRGLYGVCLVFGNRILRPGGNRTSVRPSLHGGDFQETDSEDSRFLPPGHRFPD